MNINIIAGIVIGMFNEPFLPIIIVSMVWGVVFAYYSTRFDKEPFKKYMSIVEQKKQEPKYRTHKRDFFLLQFKTAFVQSLPFALAIGLLGMIFNLN